MESKNQVTKEQEEQLRAPLPKEAIKQHPTKPYLSSINAAFMIERLNDVFGIGKWTVDAEVLEHDVKMVVVKTTIRIPEYDITLNSFGGNDNADKGDAYKGAMTDGFTKCCSYLGIGLGVWKNEKVVPTAVGATNKGNPTTHYANTHEDSRFCPTSSCGAEMKLMPAGISKKTGKPYSAFYACGECKTTQFVNLK